MVDTAIDGLRLQFPGYAEEMSRRFIRRTALRLEEREYGALRADGLIGTEVYTALMQDIGARRSRAEQYPNLLFVATSNFPRAVDSAFTSRCDLILEIPLPNKEACADILKDCLTGLGAVYPAIGKLVNAAGFSDCAAACVGLDGRAIRKMVASAIATDADTALNPERVTLAHILTAAKAAKSSRMVTER